MGHGGGFPHAKTGRSIRRLGIIGPRVVVMLAALKPLAGFVDRHPTVKMLALSFLLLIRTTLIAAGAGFDSILGRDRDPAPARRASAQVACGGRWFPPESGIPGSAA
jgi:hypothetical protein